MYGHWSILVLLMNGEEPIPEEVEEEGEESHGGLSGTAMQKRFLRYLTILLNLKIKVKTADPVVSEVIKK